MGNSSQVRKLLRGSIAKLWRGANKRLARLLLHSLCPKSHNGVTLEYLGKENGKTIPCNTVSPDFVCYSAGVGLDASFDIDLANKYGCCVHLFDPTPEAAEYLEGILPANANLVFHPIGVWRADETLLFYRPFKRGGSHSLYDLHGSGTAFEAKCRRISTIMRELGHERIDLFKLDIEGAWYPVISDLADQGIKVKILCVECDSPSSVFRVVKIIRALAKLGLRLSHCKQDDVLFVHESLLNTA